MKLFEGIKLPNNPRENRKLEKKEEIDRSKRDFLGLIGKAGVAVVGSTVLGMNLARVAENFVTPRKEETGFDKNSKRTAFSQKQEKEQEKYFDNTGEDEEEAEIFDENDEDFKSIADIVSFDKKGEIVFNKNTVGNIQHYWEERYKTEPKLSSSFSRAYYEMGAWKKKLEDIFMEQGVPKQFIYLAIPESHWNTKASSKAGAAGPYQFIKDTANDYGLLIDKMVDERCDPIKSCRACAKLLKYLYNRTGDWKLALSGYNGGFIWQYLKEADRERKKPNYEDYLDYVERQLNQIKIDYKINKKTTHYVQGKYGERVSGIAKKYGIDVRILIKANNLGNKRVIEKGIKLVIPLPEAEGKRKSLHQRRVAGYVENLNYPGKYFAVQKLIEDKVVNKQKEETRFVEKTVSAEATGEKAMTHKVAPREGLDAICRKYKITRKKALKDNPELVRYSKGLPVGFNLKIITQEKKPLTLELLGRGNPEVYQLNPSIIDPKKPLRAGMKIRFNA